MNTLNIKDQFNILFKVIDETKGIKKILSIIFILLICNTIITPFIADRISIILKNPNDSKIILIQILIIIFISAIVWSVYEWFHERLDAIVLNQIRQKMLPVLLDPNVLRRKDSQSKAFNLLINEVPHIPETVGTIIWFIMNPIWFLISIINIARYSILASFFCIIIGIIVSLISYLVYPKIVFIKKELKQHRQELTGISKDYVQHLESFKSFHSLNWIEEKFFYISNKTSTYFSLTEQLEQGLKSLTSFLTRVAMVISIASIGLSFSKTASDQLGSIGVILLLFSNAMAIIATVPMNFLWFSSCAWSTAQVFQFLDSSIKNKSLEELPNFLNSKNFNGCRIKFCEVKFSYDKFKESENHLLNVDLLINHGDFILIKGQNGKGKSTLLSLLAGDLEELDGNISIDGINLSANLRSKWMRKNAAWVCQFPVSFIGNLSDCLNPENINIPNLEVKNILEMVGLSSLYKHYLDDNINSFSSKNLSLGEIQRLSLARALILKPKLLVLDEPTSSIDSYSELLIYNILEKVKYNCNIILISHNSILENLANKTYIIENNTAKLKNKFYDMNIKNFLNEKENRVE